MFFIVRPPSSVVKALAAPRRYPSGIIFRSRRQISCRGRIFPRRRLRSAHGETASFCYDGCSEPPVDAEETCFEFPVISSQPSVQLQGDLTFNLLAQRTFPNNCNSPACPQQVTLVASVPLHICIQLGSPELPASGRSGREWTVRVSVPETAVNETHGAKSPEYNVWSSWQFSIMQAVSESPCVQSAAKNNFWSRVLAPDPGHHARTGRSIHYVRHRRSCTDLKKCCWQQISRDILGMVRPEGQSSRDTAQAESVGRLYDPDQSTARKTRSGDRFHAISPFRCDP